MHPVWNTYSADSEHGNVTCTPQINRCKCESWVSRAKVVPLSYCSLFSFTPMPVGCSSFRTMAELLWLIQKESESSNNNDQCIAHFLVGCADVFIKHVSIYFFRAVKKPNKRPQNKQQAPVTQNQLYILVNFHWITSLSDTCRNVWWAFLVKSVWDK